MLATICDEGVNLAIWQRPPMLGHDRAPIATTLAPITRIDLSASPDEIGARLAIALDELGVVEGWAAALASDVGDLACRFAAIMRAARVDVRLERITGDSCKRFHADYMSVRLITTYCGPGTEWLAQADAARVVGGQAPRDAVIRRVATGAVALMKGRLWAAQAPLVHRSPPIAGSGEQRLVLVVDVSGSA